MNWMLLYGAIAFEVCGTASLKLSNGQENLDFFVGALAFYALSSVLLALALRTLPVGVSYAIWSELGTVLAMLIGIIWFKKPLTALRVFFVVMIVGACIGLNLTTGQNAAMQ